jgi:hypothetical protein
MTASAGKYEPKAGFPALFPEARLGLIGTAWQADAIEHQSKD